MANAYRIVGPGGVGEWSLDKGKTGDEVIKLQKDYPNAVYVIQVADERTLSRDVRDAMRRGT